MFIICVILLTLPFVNYNLEYPCVNIFTLQNIFDVRYVHVHVHVYNYAFMLVKYFDKSSCSIKKFTDTKLLNDAEICNT